MLSKKYSSRVEWVNEISHLKDIFLIANEVLDAIPTKRFLKKENKGWFM